MHFLTLQTPAALTPPCSLTARLCPSVGQPHLPNLGGVRIQRPQDAGSRLQLPPPPHVASPVWGWSRLPRLGEGAWAATARVLSAIRFYSHSGSRLTQGPILETIRDVLHCLFSFCRGGGGKEGLSPPLLRTDGSRSETGAGPSLCHCTLLYQWVPAPSLSQSGTPASLG